VFFLIQFYGMSDGNAVAASADQAAPQGQVANIQIDWAVVGLVGAGVVVMLLRPRRRVQTK
jgi:cell division protein FtsW (lipid II flippase)